MEISRFIELCRQSTSDTSARDALWSGLFDAYYRRLCTFAKGKMFRGLRQSEAQDIVCDVLERIVVRCHLVTQNVYGVCCAEVNHRIIDEARRDNKWTTTHDVDDGLEEDCDDNSTTGKLREQDSSEQHINECACDPINILIRDEDEEALNFLQQHITKLRDELKIQQENSRSALYMHELIEYHHFGGVSIRDLAESMSQRLAEKGEKPVSYGNLRNINMALIAKLRELKNMHEAGAKIPGLNPQD